MKKEIEQFIKDEAEKKYPNAGEWKRRADFKKRMDVMHTHLSSQHEQEMDAVLKDMDILISKESEQAAKVFEHEQEIKELRGKYNELDADAFDLDTQVKELKQVLHDKVKENELLKNDIMRLLAQIKSLTEQHEKGVVLLEKAFLKAPEPLATEIYSFIQSLKSKMK